MGREVWWQWRSFYPVRSLKKGHIGVPWFWSSVRLRYAFIFHTSLVDGPTNTTNSTCPKLNFALRMASPLPQSPKSSLGDFLLLLKSSSWFPFPSLFLTFLVLFSILPSRSHTRARMISLDNLIRLLLCLKVSRWFQEDGQAFWHRPFLVPQVFHIPPHFLYFEHNIFFKYNRLFEISIL